MKDKNCFYHTILSKTEPHSLFYIEFMQILGTKMLDRPFNVNENVFMLLTDIEK